MKSFFQQLKTQWTSLPRGANILLYTEICELYGRFGIIALLMLYLTHALHMSDTQAFSLYAGFLTLLFALPVMGGYVADRFLGPIVAVMLGIAFMMVGNAFLVVPHVSDVSLGLMLIAVGAAIFTPTLSAMLHHLYGDRPEDHDTGFMLYYLARNVGALSAPLIGGIIATYHGYPMAFLMNLVVMLSGMVVFYTQRSKFFRGDLGQQCAIRDAMRKVHPWVRKRPVLGVLAVTVVGALLAVTLDSVTDMGRSWIFVCLAVAFAVGLFCQILYAKWIKPRVIFEILIAFFVVAIFSMFLWQGGATLNLFIDRLVDRQAFGITLPTTFFYALSPMFMLTVGPVLFMMLRRVTGTAKLKSAMQKYALGLSLLGVGFAIFAVAARQAQWGAASPWFVVLAYFLFPLGELAVMPVALSYVTQRAPSGTTATMAGFLTLSVAVASYGMGWIARFASVSTEQATRLAMAEPYFRVFQLSSAVLLAVALIVIVGQCFLRDR